MKMPARLLSVIVLVLTLSPRAEAQLVTTYTNSSSFLAAVAASNFTQNFSSFEVGATNSPLNFTGNGFSYTALTDPDFYILPDKSLSVGSLPTQTLTFTNFSANISAIGGNFYATGSDFLFTNTPISIFATLVDSSTFATNYFPGGISSFLGLAFATNIVKLVVSNAPSSPSPEFMTVDNITVGVPEPSTYALLGLAAAGLAGYALRRRRQ
jgi:hypothetical protein